MRFIFWQKVTCTNIFKPVSNTGITNLYFIADQTLCQTAVCKNKLSFPQTWGKIVQYVECMVILHNHPDPLLRLLQMCQMFKGFDKAKDIQYVYTPVFSSLCGVKLDSNNKAGYLMWSDGRLSIGQCDLVESWDNLSLSQRKNLNYRYQMGCECRINVCYTVPCASTGENECLWTDWLLDNSLNGEQARQYACIRRSDTTCGWYRGGHPRVYRRGCRWSPVS
uniref:TIMP metallopeptidase inhibitor 4 n=1 Tax=Hippocampus comes TaxID=109280 RepID=A0A3Q2YCJ4_HIPCM